MYLKDKNVLVYGLGITGLSAIKAINKLGANILISDNKSEEELKGLLNTVDYIPMEKYLQTNTIPMEKIDLIIKSPGIPPNTPLLVEARRNNIEIITDLELAYRLNRVKNIIAITGTNGKTTTTTLVGEIFKKAGYSTFLTGNIGVGILENIVDAQEEDIFIVEASSFQLEDTIDFKPKISLIINISPDHINWHGSYENYIKAKKKMLINQDDKDYTILNYDDEVVRNMASETKGNILWFSVKNRLEKGIFIEEDRIIIRDENKEIEVLNINEIRIPGKHNLENILGALSIPWIMGINLEIIKEGLIKFTGVPHRIEFVRKINGISFYNDSKGTNPAASIKAIDALEGPIILIAGGQNKNSEFKDFIIAFNDKVKDLILLGETKEKIKSVALEQGFKSIHLVNSMEEAVLLSYKIANKDSNILLSPACASWDMYKSFEERGEDFKGIVQSIKEDLYE